jgi:hypothetical protein
MPYVKRENGKIISYSRWDNIGEQIGYDSPELLDYFNKTGDYAEVETYLDKRKKEYGTPEEQLEYIVENGLQAFITKQNAIKNKYSKE